MTEDMYLHSRCCMAHWELVYNEKTGGYRLECEKCGKESGVVTVSGKPLDKLKCACCGDDANGRS
jgi:hypothetical protein